VVELRDITMDDLPMYERSLTDPQMLIHLGGSPPQQDLSEKLRRIVDDVKTGTVWFSVILPDGESGAAAGSVCIWDHDWNGETISEMGWMVLPEFQGRGLATEAVRSLLERARSEHRWDVIHAFPAVTKRSLQHDLPQDQILEDGRGRHRVLGRAPAMQPLAHRPWF
jgi:RimJ/RimL family protein N-acetyltransferase